MRVIQPSFASGELAPSLRSRVDLAKYASGLSLCENFIVHPHGGVSNRPGLEFTTATKGNAAAVLIPFAYNTQDTYMLEFGDGYMRVKRQGAVVSLPSAPAAWVTATAYVVTDHVSSGGVNYYCHTAHTSGATTEPGVGASWADYWHALTDDAVEIPTPYAAADLEDLRFAQSADIITIVHPSHAPAELSRTDHHLWALETITFTIEAPAPTNLAAAWTGAAVSTVTRKYVVTAVSAATSEESLPATEATVDTEEDWDWNNGEYVTLTWDAVSGAETYNVYKEDNGIFGYIGSTPDLTFIDDKISPELGDTPPAENNPFDGAGNYPSTVSYYEQRVVYAATTNKPQTLWFSRTGYFHSFAKSVPAKADDSIEVTIDSNQVNSIQHLVPLNDLIVLTAGAEWKITSGDNAFSIDSIRVKPQGFRGSHTAPPLVIGNTILFVQAKGAVIRDLGYALESDSYTGADLSILSNHLFRNRRVRAWAYAQSPDSIIWVVLDDGSLVALTYQREHEVWAWHKHTTDGTFEWVATVPEGNEDAVYFVVNRTIGGQTKRYIERMHSRCFDDVTDCFFVDSGLTYDGAATASLSGLDHLEGETVSVMGDGNVMPDQVVTSGAITLPVAVSKAHVGLAYSANLRTLEWPIEQAHAKFKSTARVTVRLLDSRGGWVGSDVDTLVEIKQRTTEDYGDPIQPQSQDFEVVIPPGWEYSARIQVQQPDPLPITVAAIIPDVQVGG